MPLPRIPQVGLESDVAGKDIQAVPLVEGKVGLGAGSYWTNGVIHCVEDGDITIVWNSGGTPTTIEAVAGDDYGYYGDVIIVSGVFHLC